MFPIKLLFLDMRLCAFRVPVSVAVAVLFGTILNSGLERNDGCTGCGYGRLRRGTLKTVSGMSVYRNMSWLFYGAAVVEVFPGHGPEFVKRRGEPNGGGRTIDNGKTGAGLRCRSLDVGDRLGGWTENESDSDGLLPSGRVEMVRETGGMENEDVVSGRWMHCFPERVEVFGPVRRRGGTECPLFF